MNQTLPCRYPGVKRWACAFAIPSIGYVIMMSIFGVIKESVDFHVWSNAVCGLHLQEVQERDVGLLCSLEYQNR
jgi:hypothetical protein